MITLTMLAESKCRPGWSSQLTPVCVSDTARPASGAPRTAARMPRDIRAARAWPAAEGDVQIPAATVGCAGGLATADPEARLAAGAAVLAAAPAATVARSRATAGVGSARASGSILAGRG
jgi:hypothetical protein